MANAREILSRIKSIKDTKKITNAMYMVSSSKLQKAKKDLQNTEPYFLEIQESMAKILNFAPEVGSKFFDQREHKKGADRRIGYLVITADKGLAGAYNHNVIRLAEEIALNEEDDMLFVVGQVGKHYYTAQNPSMNRARHIAEKLLELFLEEKIDEVYVIYTRMINSMTVEPMSKKILPLKEMQSEAQDKNNHYDNARFEPNVQTVFDNIVPNYVAGFIYGALIESYCSEHNSRMMAMQTATDAATDMIKQLGIQYNRARQAAITQEITEVIAGSKAQKNK